MTAPPAALGRRSAVRNPQPEPTAVRSALRGGGLLVLAGLLLLLVVLSTWIGTKDTTLGQVWTALRNDDGSYATEVIRQLRLPRTLVGLMIALLPARPLNSLALGEELGRALGARIDRTRIAAVIAVTPLCGASTAAAGPIGFMGLVVPPSPAG
ncbi:iron chelate uptake ABC transporter family permease subunit [Streptomyces anulatus]|uniref:iron chelate uptake ABC transporter family permease subunit n=1 Tax=Streptomyces anulatus TaxID=1892 RepID=UPI0036B31C7B